MSAELYASAWRTGAQLARAGLRLGIVIGEAALVTMRMAERSLSSTEVPATKAPPSQIKPTEVAPTPGDVA